MDKSPDSMSDSTNSESSQPVIEELADLTQNHDESLDLALAFGAIGGLRHSAACDAAERSTRRFDDRQHRFHETRMKAMGMEGEEQKPEADDMAQQVLIRSPVNHHYHYPSGPAAAPQQPSQPASPPQQGMSPWTKAAIGAAIASGLLGPAAGYLLSRNGGSTVINQPIEKAPGQNIGTLPPIPPED